jgi:hypothetical protein
VEPLPLSARWALVFHHPPSTPRPLAKGAGTVLRHTSHQVEPRAADKEPKTARHESSASNERADPELEVD